MEDLPAEPPAGPERHAELVERDLSDEATLVARAVGLFESLVEYLRQSRVEGSTSSQAAWFCFRRTLDQLRLAQWAAHHGCGTEVATLGRAAWESAALGGMLANDRKQAERWIDGNIIGNSEVREWYYHYAEQLSEVLGDDPGTGGTTKENLREVYRAMSEHAHPSRAVIGGFLLELAHRAMPLGSKPFLVSLTRPQLRLLAYMALSSAYFLEHACVDPGSIPDHLQRELDAVHEASLAWYGARGQPGSKNDPQDASDEDVQRWLDAQPEEFLRWWREGLSAKGRLADNRMNPGWDRSLDDIAGDP